MSEIQHLCSSCGEPFSRSHGVFLGTKMCSGCRDRSSLQDDLHEALKDFRERGLDSAHSEREVLEIIESRVSDPETRFVCGDCHEAMISEGEARCFGCQYQYDQREREEERAREEREREWERFKSSHS